MPSLSRLASPLVVLILTGCTGAATEKGEDSGPSWVDADADGMEASVDCDDQDPDIHPGAAESCDGVDDDCDGHVDEGVTTTWYADADHDGFGDPTKTSLACDEPVGFSALGADCDDANAEVHPDATEVCNELDDDCDGTVDDSGGLWYADIDGDGHGDTKVSARSCEGASGFVASGDDCDDRDEARHPGADEVCDGADNDCDERIDDDDDDCIDPITWYGDVDGDGHGDALAALAACEAPDGTVAEPGDCDDADSAVHPAALEVCDTIDNDCDGRVDDDDDTLDPESLSTWCFDWDGDGFGDPGVTHAACEAPASYVEDARDCDDTDSSVHPEGIEVCNGVDDDCDGALDDGDGDVDLATGSLWYADTDGDGYGAPASSRLACDEPAGHVATGDDCNDTDAQVNPDGIEICNGVDDDCDGASDDADADLDTATLLDWFADADGDGFGDPTDGQRACEAPLGTTADDRDCNDSDAAVSPAAEELCDGLDNDCDGAIDDGDDDVDYCAVPADDILEGELVVSEVLRTPLAVDDSVGEWFEVYNASSVSLDLDGLNVSDAAGNGFTVDGTLVVGPEDFALFGVEADPARNGGVTLDHVWDPADFELADDGEILLSSGVSLIDALYWDDGVTFPSTEGSAMAAKPPLMDATSNDAGDAWCETDEAFGDGDLGTPGAANSCETSTLGNDEAGDEVGTFNVGYLLGQALVLEEAAVIAGFGLFVDTTVDHEVLLGVYDDNGGAPGSLRVGTDSWTLSEGENLVPAQAETALEAGTYYLMGVYDGTGYPSIHMESGPMLQTFYSATGYTLPERISSVYDYSDSPISYFVTVY